MSSSELRGNRLCALWFLSVIVVFSLGCFAFEYHLTYEEDGSGTLHLEGLAGTMPQARSDLAKDLAAKGWKNVSVNPAGKNRLGLSADYPFDASQEIAPLRDYFRDATLKGESAENGDTYYTWTSTVDFSSIEAQWKAFEADFAANGVKVGEEGAQGFGALLGVTEVITPEEARELLADWPKPAIGLKVQLPGNTPVEANEHWLNAQKYMERKDSSTKFLWGVGRPCRDKADLKAVRRKEEHGGSVTAPKLKALLDRYEREIPRGTLNVTAVPYTGFEGWANNILDGIISFVKDYDAYTCADYQQIVLDWLGGFRTNTDSDERALLDGWAYGPIQTQGGSHRAVVLYARGTDWRTKGIVLDPWPLQAPKYFEIAQWWWPLWNFAPIGASSPEVDSDQGHLYPHLSGKPESYPASEDTGDLPKGRAKPTRIIILRCPVTALLTTPDGRRLGATMTGTLVNELGPGASFYSIKTDGKEGDLTWILFLPDVEFSLDIRGKGKGEFHATVVSKDGIQSFGTQPIRPGESATLQTIGGRLSPMSRSNGTQVEPKTVTPEQARKEMGLPERAAPQGAAAPVSAIGSLAWAPDGEVLAMAIGRTSGGSFEGSVDVVEAAGMRPVGQATFSQEAAIAVAYSPDGRKLAVALGRQENGKRVGRISVLNAETWTPLGEAGPFPEWTVSLAFSPDGARIVAGSWDGLVTFLDAERASQLGFASLGGSVWSVSFSPDGRTVACGATGQAAGTSRLALLGSDGRVAWSADGPPGGSLRVAYGPDGRTIAIAAADGTVSVRDAASGRALWSVRGHAGAASAIACSPDGRCVGSGGHDRKVCLWDAGTGAPVRTFEGHQGRVNCLAFSPDGSVVASGGWEGELKIWDLRK